MLSWQVSGVAEMQHRLLGVANRLSTSAGVALYRQGAGIMRRSQSEFVPVKTGALKASGRVSGPLRYGRDWVVELIYGGPQAPYALTQHETPWFRHRVGQWKYLEQPLYEASATLLTEVASEMTRG